MTAVTVTAVTKKSRDVLIGHTHSAFIQAFIFLWSRTNTGEFEVLCHCKKREVNVAGRRRHVMNTPLTDISNHTSTKPPLQKALLSPYNPTHDKSEAAALEEQLLYMKQRLLKLQHRSNLPSTKLPSTKEGRDHDATTAAETKEPSPPTATAINTPKSKPTTLELRAESAHKLMHLPPLDSKFKILVVGNSSCGKTSIIERFISNTFSPEYHSTIGADFRKKVLNWSLLGDKNIAEKVKLHVFDIAGQDRFAKLTRSFFQKAKGAMVVCDVTREGTFEAAGEWKREIDRALTTYDEQGRPVKIPVLLVANKCDLLTDVTSSFVAGAKMEAACRQHGFAGWFVSSAKNGANISNCMCYLTRQMLAVRDLDRAKVQQIYSKTAGTVGPDTFNPYDSIAPTTGLRVQRKASQNDIERMYGNSKSEPSGRKKSGGCC
jgi:small GTP-binding protein